MKRLKNDGAITLIALIITIIILVILAAVSIRAAYNMGIVGYAVNGAEGYSKAAKDEEKIMQDTENYLGSIIGNINNGESEATDKDAPEITITGFTTALFVWSATDESEIVGYQITETPDEPTDGWITEGTLTGGEYSCQPTQKKYYIWVIDEFGNIGSKSIKAWSVKGLCNPGGTINLINAGVNFQNSIGSNMTSTNWVLEGREVTIEAGTCLSGYSITSIKLNGEEVQNGSSFIVTGNMEVDVYTTH